MKVKQRSDDFRVRELLGEDVLAPRGEFRVYRVIKSKLTSFEAARALAYEAGANAGDVSMCGLKDRQGVTLQHMALRHGPAVSVRSPELRIETAGFASDPLDSKASEGNAFEIVLRGLTQEDIETLRANAHALREKGGLINYFDDQRFGNLRHGQGWIALALMRGEHEDALRALLTARSPHDDTKSRAFKRALSSYWGDWTSCRDIAGKFGEHHSLFEHLKKSPDDFAGAFYHLASRLRLIHLYAYQSHLWNRAVADWVRARVEPAQRVVLECAEGPLVYPETEVDLGVDADTSFRLPGPKLADVSEREHFDLFADVLAHDRLVPAQFVIEGVSGFQLKGEDRALFVKPNHLRLRPMRPDALNPGALSIEVRFELPRGAYATLVVRRLLQTSSKRSKAVPPRALDPEREADRRAPARDGDEPRERKPRAPRVGAKSGAAGKFPRPDYGPPKRVRLPDREGEAPPGKRERNSSAGPRGAGGAGRGPNRGPSRGPRREFDGPPRGPRREFERSGPAQRRAAPERGGPGSRDERRSDDRPLRSRDAGAPPRRDSAGPRRDSAGPRRDSAGPRRDSAGPRRDSAGPRRDSSRPTERAPRERVERPKSDGAPRKLPLADWKPKRRTSSDGDRE